MAQAVSLGCQTMVLHPGRAPEPGFCPVRMADTLSHDFPPAEDSPVLGMLGSAAGGQGCLGGTHLLFSPSWHGCLQVFLEVVSVLCQVLGPTRCCAAHWDRVAGTLCALFPPVSGAQVSARLRHVPSLTEHHTSQKHHAS